MCHRLLAFVFVALPSCWMEFKSCYSDAPQLVTRFGCWRWHIFNHCIQNQPSHSAMNWSYVLVLLHREQSGLKLVHTVFFFFETPQKICWAQARIPRMIMTPSQRPQWTRVFIFWTLASAGFSSATTCRCCHSTSFSSWLPWHNCKERE